MKQLKALINTTAIIAAATASGYAQAREHIEVVGSSTVYPFSTVVAETFGNKIEFPTPKIESTGSGGGLKLLFSGTGVDTPILLTPLAALRPVKLNCAQATALRILLRCNFVLTALPLPTPNPLMAYTMN